MRLTLFLTHTLSLRTWHDMGTFDREVAIYRKLQDMGVSIDIVSYGGRDEYEFRSQLPDMRILCNWIGWSSKRYTYRLHQLHGFRLWQSDLFKTNQLNGSQVAVRASQIWKRPMIARFGYLWSALEIQNHPSESRWMQHVNTIQDNAFEQAEHVIMTSSMMLEDVIKTHPTIASKTTIIPNYVDMDVFYPNDCPKIYDLVYVGRLAPIKNLRNLLLAIQDSDYTLALIGDGDLLEDLQSEFGDLDGRLNWMGRIDNNSLPDMIRQARIFILTSFSEGHPKALIEAMACGIPAIGTPVQGIKHIIEHEQTGYLAEGTDAKSLSQAIGKVLSSPELIATMSENAHHFALRNYSLDMIAKVEYRLYQDILQNRRVE